LNPTTFGKLEPEVAGIIRQTVKNNHYCAAVPRSNPSKTNTTIDNQPYQQKPIYN